MIQYEIHSGKRYLFDASPNEDPFDAARGIRDARIIKVEGGEREEVYHDQPALIVEDEEFAEYADEYDD